jgi:hypothetical protein
MFDVILVSACIMEGLTMTVIAILVIIALLTVLAREYVDSYSYFGNIHTHALLRCKKVCVLRQCCLHDEYVRGEMIEPPQKKDSNFRRYENHGIMNTKIVSAVYNANCVPNLEDRSW